MAAQIQALHPFEQICFICGMGFVLSAPLRDYGYGRAHRTVTLRHSLSVTLPVSSDAGITYSAMGQDIKERKKFQSSFTINKIIYDADSICSTFEL